MVHSVPYREGSSMGAGFSDLGAGFSDLIGAGVRRLKRGFRRIVSFFAQGRAWKVRFCKPCTSATSESDSDHADRILRLKVGVLVYTVSRLSKCRFLILWALHGSLRCCNTDCETDCTTLLSLETQDIERGQLQCARNYAENPYVF